jgi:capsular polysaccharide biosynthesis protein
MINLLKKVAKRLKRTIVKIVPYNLSYKPKGYYRTIGDFIGSGREKNAQCMELYPEYVSCTDIAGEYLDKCTKYLDFPSVATIPSSRLVVVPNGRLYSDGVENVSVITPDNKLLGEVTYQNNPSNRIEENVLLKQNYFIPVRRYKGTVFHLLIGGSGSTNYFHWLFDSLARIHLLKKSGWFEKTDWFLVPAHKVDYQKDSLRMLGISEDKIIVGDAETHIQADLLLATTYVRYFDHVPEWCCNFLREHFLKSEYVADTTMHPFIYISRKDATRRRIVNEDELLRLLGEYGFKSYELAGLPFREKIRLFNNAEVILAPHGAGQANLVFCESGTDVLEFAPEGFAYPTFYDIANKAGLNFNYLFPQLDTKSTSMSRLIRANMMVDLGDVKQKLDEIMNRRKASKQTARAEMQQEL